MSVYSVLIVHCQHVLSFLPTQNALLIRLIWQLPRSRVIGEGEQLVSLFSFAKTSLINPNPRLFRGLKTKTSTLNCIQKPIKVQCRISEKYQLCIELPSNKKNPIYLGGVANAIWLSVSSTFVFFTACSENCLKEACGFHFRKETDLALVDSQIGALLEILSMGIVLSQTRHCTRSQLRVGCWQQPCIHHNSFQNSGIHYLFSPKLTPLTQNLCTTSVYQVVPVSADI